MTTSLNERKALLGKAPKKISIKRGCELCSVTRSNYYYQAKGESDLNLELMKEIDKHYMDYPFMGVPSMTVWLNMDKGYNINKKRVSRLYQLMDLQAIIPGPHTSRGCKEHKKYPYLLRNLKISKPNQVWGIDITYVPIKGGFMYLIAIIDHYSRYIVSWSLSNTMEAEWCVETVKKAITRHGKPDILNSDQGSQFTSEIFTEYLLSQGIKISMDGKGRATDNIFIERFWRDVKYEDIYLKAYENGLDLYKGLKVYMNFHNAIRRHSSLEHKRPADLYIAA
jgi:putative transposase